MDVGGVGLVLGGLYDSFLLACNAYGMVYNYMCRKLDSSLNMSQPLARTKVARASASK
jgi:hypothetical protein